MKNKIVIVTEEIEIMPSESYNIKSLVCTRNDLKYPTPEYKVMPIEPKEWMHLHDGIQ